MRLWCGLFMPDILGITAHTLLHGQHLHLTASIDGQEQMVLDLRPNTK
jgi:hypothetical protein